MPALIDTAAVRVPAVLDLDDNTAEQREMVSIDGTKDPVTETSPPSLVSNEQRELNGEIREEIAEYVNQEISASITDKIEKPQPVTPEASREGGGWGEGGENSLESDKERWNTNRMNREQQLKGSTSKDDEDFDDDDDSAPDLIDEDSSRPTNLSFRGNRKRREKYDDASSSDDDSSSSMAMKPPPPPPPPTPSSSEELSFSSSLSSLSSAGMEAASTRRRRSARELMVVFRFFVDGMDVF